jgi:hypothetical protein
VLCTIANWQVGAWRGYLCGPCIEKTHAVRVRV